MKLSNHHDLFLKELIDYYSEKYNRFNEYQSLVVETLEFFHGVCVKYDIPYYLAYGSLLGALRDGGQIPWDYDIDVHVPFSHAKKLIKALQKEVSDKYHFTTRFCDKNNRTYTLKLSPIGYDCEVFHVDVFWLFGMDENAFDNNKQKIAKYTRLLYHKFLDFKYLMSSTRKSEKIACWIYKIKSSLYCTRQIDRYLEKVFSRKIEDCDYLTDNACEVLFKKEWFSDRILFRLSNDKEFYIPSHYDAILKKIYGDYAVNPPIENRVNEFVRSINRLEKLSRL